jgi:hypothetical protein
MQYKDMSTVHVDVCQFGPSPAGQPNLKSGSCTYVSALPFEHVFMALLWRLPDTSLPCTVALLHAGLRPWRHARLLEAALHGRWLPRL